MPTVRATNAKKRRIGQRLALALAIFGVVPTMIVAIVVGYKWLSSASQRDLTAAVFTLMVVIAVGYFVRSILIPWLVNDDEEDW